MDEEVGAVGGSEDVGSGSVDGSTPEAGTPGTSEHQVNPFAGTKHKVRINNQDVEVPYEKLLSGFGITQAAQEKFEAAAKMRKDVDGLIGTLKAGDLQILKDLGVPKDKIHAFAEKELSDYLDYENLSEPDKKRIAAEQERDTYKKQFEEQQENTRQEQLAVVEQRVTNELDSEIGQAIRDVIASEGFDPARPVEPWFVKNVVDLMISHMESSDDTTQRMSAKTATERAWGNMRKDVQSYLGSVPTSKAMEMLTPELREAIRRADVGDAVSSMQTRIRSKHTGDEQMPKRKDERVSTDEFFKQIEKRWK